MHCVTIHENSTTNNNEAITVMDSGIFSLYECFVLKYSPVNTKERSTVPFSIVIIAILSGRIGSYASIADKAVIVNNNFTIQNMRL
jgi:hypothetical protein